MKSSALAASVFILSFVSGCKSPQPKTDADRVREKSAQTRLAETKKNLTLKSLAAFAREYPDRPEAPALLADLAAARFQAAAKQNAPDAWFFYLVEFPDSAKKAEALGLYRDALNRRIKELKSPYLARLAKPVLAAGPSEMVQVTAGQSKVLAEAAGDSPEFQLLLCAKGYFGELVRTGKLPTRLTAMGGLEELASRTGKAPESCRMANVTAVRGDSAADLSSLLQKMRRASQGTANLTEATRAYQQALDQAKELAATTAAKAKEFQADPKAAAPAKEAKARAAITLKGYEKRRAEALAAKVTLDSLDAFENTAALVAAGMVGF